MNPSDDPTKVSVREPAFSAPGHTVYPVCPYCGLDPAKPLAITLRLGNFMILAIFCANLHCRKILAMNVLSIEQPRVVMPSGSRLVVPS